MTPRPPHPGILAALGWSLVFLVFTQGPSAAVMVAFMISRMSGAEDYDSPAELFRTEDGSKALVVVIGVSQIASIVMSIAVLRGVAGRDWARLVGLRMPHPAHIVLALIAAPALFVFAEASYILFQEAMQLAIRSVGGRVPDDNSLNDLLDSLRHWPVWVPVLLIGLGPGIGEELWCRGFLGRGLVARYGWPAGMLMTSVIFGAIHLNPVQGSMAVLMGLVLHWSYLCSRSILVPVFLHFFNNGMRMWQVSESAEVPDWLGALQLQGGWTTPKAQLAAASLLVLVTTAVMFYMTRAKPLTFDGRPAGGASPAAGPPHGGRMHVGWAHLGGWLLLACSVVVFAGAWIGRLKPTVLPG